MTTHDRWRVALDTRTVGYRIFLGSDFTRVAKAESAEYAKQIAHDHNTVSELLKAAETVLRRCHCEERSCETCQVLSAAKVKGTP